MPLQAGQASVFMGVPPMYSMLVATYDSLAPDEQAKARAAAQGLRLTVCGSSACPVPLMHRWREISGQYLLERWVQAKGELGWVQERGSTSATRQATMKRGMRRSWLVHTSLCLGGFTVAKCTVLHGP
jgi:acyl-CoA synthetase (AMP-forming)/AMP-acid ligase II